MDSINIPNAAPQALRTGKPRSFWTIVGLSIITCGIYYIVYHFMVTSEVKKATTWAEDEPFKPSTFIILFGAYVVLSYVFPMFFGIALFLQVFLEALANPGAIDQSAFAMQNQYQMASSMYMIMISAVGYYVAYYFFKLNDIAAYKVGAKPLGIRPVFIAYSIFFAVMLLNSLMEIAIVALDINANLANDLNDIENLDFSTLGPFIMLAIMGLGMGLFMLVTSLYFLWKQTELVNHVWEAGHFSTPLVSNIYGPPAGAQTSGPVAYPSAQIPQAAPPVTPAPPIPPVDPSKPDTPTPPESNNP